MLFEIVLDIDAYWTQSKPFIENAIIHSCNELDIDDILQNLKDGNLNLAIIKNEDEVIIGAMIIQSFIRNKQRIGFILAAGGKQITTTKHWESFKSYMKSLGFSYIEGAMRDSTLRLWSRLGFKKKYSIAGVEI